MSSARGIEIRALTSTKGGMTDFYTPQTSDQTILVQIPPHTIEDLFCVCQDILGLFFDYSC